MSAWLAILGALGGASVFVGAVWAVLRAVFKQTDAIHDNTEATAKLTDKLEDMGKQVRSNTVEIARLQGRRWPRRR